MATSRQPSTTFRFVFVGKLERRKHVGLLLEALAQLDTREWELLIAGGGGEQPHLERRVAELGLSQCITFLGPVSHGRATALIGTADCVVLPSRFDGWGMVVNEALQQGVRVIASSMVGAADVIVGHADAGTIFTAGDACGLRRSLRDELQRPRASVDQQSLLADWATDAMSSRSGAMYLLAIMQWHRDRTGPRPEVPWQR